MEMDPYVVLIYGNQKETTEEAKGLDKEPVWNNTKFLLDIKNAGGKGLLQVMCYDKKRFLMDNFIGGAKIYLKEHVSKTSKSEEFPVFLYKDREYAGKVMMKMRYVNGMEETMEYISPIETAKGSVLMVAPREAQFPNNINMIMKMDPYCVISLGGKNEASTKVSPDGNKNPSWNDKLMYAMDGDEKSLDVRIFDKNKYGDDLLIAESKIELEKLILENKGSGWFELDRNQEHFGRVFLDWGFDGEYRRARKERPVFGANPSQLMSQDPQIPQFQTNANKPTPSTPTRPARRPPMLPTALLEQPRPIQEDYRPIEMKVRPRKRERSYRAVPMKRSIVRVLTPSPQRFPITTVQLAAPQPAVIVGNKPAPMPRRTYMARPVHPRPVSMGISQNGVGYSAVSSVVGTPMRQVHFNV